MSSQRPLVIAAAAFGALALLGAGIWLGRASSAAAEKPMSTEREAAYRRLIDEANARIARQNQMLAAASRPEGPKAQPGIDANAAAAAAYRRAPGARLSRPPELVSYRGLPAYEVVLDRGTVYVDASTSEVLHDGTTPADDGSAAPLALNGKRKSKHHEDHDDHEDDDD
ncbi:MAG: hypothetical protein HS104_20675 [Polyangiaceae bacterium]|nr:hypothetical protein [Polyangiaceae bacterium]